MKPCSKAERERQYADPLSRNPDKGRLLTTNRHIRPVLLVQPSYCDLKSSEVQYFNRFRDQIVYQLGSHPFDDFWSRTVLRESSINESVLQTILGIGALGQALESAPRNVPLYKVPLSYSTNVDYARAIKYYTSSLVKLRRQISSDELKVSSRSVLISTILCSAFELLQGDSISADKHIISGGSILKDMLMKSAWPDGKSQIAASYDDEGVEDAEFILMRRLSFKCLLSPSCSKERDNALNVPCTTGPDPPDQRESFEVFWKVWLRLLTIIQVWYNRVEFLDCPTALKLSSKLHQEREILLVQIKTWEAAIKCKSDQERDIYGISILRQILLGVKTLHFCLHTVFETTADVEGNRIGHEICSIAESILASTPLLQAGLGEVYEGMQAIMIGMCLRCRDYDVRSRAMSICKGVFTANSRWDGKELLLRTSALLDLEELGRDEKGSIPLASRYNCISSSWSNDYTQLTTVFEPQGVEKDVNCEKKVVILRPEDFGLI